MDSLKSFLTMRITIGILLAIVVLWAANAMFSHVDAPEAVIPGESTTAVSSLNEPTHPAEKTATETQSHTTIAPASKAATSSDSHTVLPAKPGAEAGVSESSEVKGVAFVNAVIAPLDYELNSRFYGWRPNDIVDMTDNVENYQRGVLEVSRRAVRILTERISRTGNTVAFNTNLENAMNWLMVKADTYWFPSPETKYQEAIDELELYKAALENGDESFFTRTDSIIPLLQVFEDLLGSCEENLVKTKEKDGSDVGTFVSDDYFFYAKGVAGAMHTILEAVQEDFGSIMESRKGTDDLTSALESLHHAYEISPILVLNSDPGSLWANHRANMAAPISHAKFYLGVLINTLST